MASSSVSKVNAQVDEVIDIMHKNAQQVIAREEKIGNLQDQSEALLQQTQDFRQGSKQLHRSMWWKNMKLKLLIVGMCLLILGVVITAAVLSSRK
jgi:t-SNARE complex subunit (syntaxin)